MSTASAAGEQAKPAEQTGLALLRVVGLGLFLGAVATAVVMFGRGEEWKSPVPTASPKSDPTFDQPAPGVTASVQRSADPSPVTSKGDISPSGIAAIAETLSNDGPKHDPGGKIPKPHAGSLFYRSQVDAHTALRVYNVQGSPESAMTAFGKELETAGFHREGSDEKADRRGRYRRNYAKADVAAMITASPGEKGTLITIVEGARKDEP